MFSHPRHGEGAGEGIRYMERVVHGSSVTNGQCPRADDKLVRAKYWMFFSKSFLCRMTRLIPGATSPLPSQIFLRTSFCQICHRSSATWTKKTPESIKFLLKVTQIILDVLWPNSNKPQSHKFVWVLSGDLVQ